MTSTTTYALRQWSPWVGTSADPAGTLRITVVTVILRGKRWDVAPRVGGSAEACRGRARSHRADEETEWTGGWPVAGHYPWRSK